MIKLIKLLKKLQARLIKRAISKTESNLHSVAEVRDLVEELAEKRVEMADKLYAHLLERAEAKRVAGAKRVEQERKNLASVLDELHELKAGV